MGWLAIAFIVVASLVVWGWTPPPANWVMSGASMLSCLFSSYFLVKGYQGRSLVAVAFGFLIIGLIPTYEWALRPVVSSSALWTKYGLLLFAVIFVALVPLFGALASRMLFSSRWRVLGIVVLVAPAVLGVVAGIAYWVLFVLVGPASRASVDQQRLFALITIPVLFTLAVFLGIALHRAWLGLLDLS